MAVLTPTINVREEQASSFVVTPVSSRIPIFFVVTERGPTDEPTLVTSFADFERQFGRPLADYSDMWWQVRLFFVNAGQGVTFAWVVRVVHHLTQGDPSSVTTAVGSLTLQTASGSPTAAYLIGSNVEPFLGISAGDTLTIPDVDGSGPQVATFSAAAADLTAGNAGPYNLTDGDTFTLLANDFLGKTVVFPESAFPDISAATAAQVAAEINGQIGLGYNYAYDVGGTLHLRSRTEGAAGVIQVTGGTANDLSKLNFSLTPATGSGAQGLLDVAALSAAEVKAVLEADITTPPITVDTLPSGAVRLVSTTTGPTSALQVAAGPVQASLGLSTNTVNGTTGLPVDTVRLDGRTAYDNSSIKVRVQIPSRSGQAGLFDLILLEDEIEVETFVDLSMDSASPRYIEKIVNQEIGAGGSPRVLAEDLGALAQDTRPAPGTFGPMAGGSDGLVGLADADFIGAVGSGVELTKTGFRLIDELLEDQLAPQIGPLVPGRASSAILAAITDYAENLSGGVMFALHEFDASVTTASAAKSAYEAAGIAGTTEFASAWYPMLAVANDRTDVFDGERLYVGPVGAVAGVLARNDAANPFGVGRSPGGLRDVGEVRGVVGVRDLTLTDISQRAILGLARINPIYPSRRPRSSTDSTQVYLGDVVTARSAEQGALFPQIQQRRLAIYIKQSLRRAFRGLMLDDNTPQNRRAAKSAADDFLADIKASGELVDYRTDIGERVNPPDLIESERFAIEVSIKPRSAIRELVITIRPFSTGGAA